MIMRKLRSFLLLAIGAGAGSPALAGETITYTYDANGRLVQVVHTGTVNNNLQTTYTHDNADNRTNVTVTNASH
jgi:hypothetical protein